MVMPADYYETLGVSRGANDEDIRRAFRRKAMEFHPDRNKTPGAEDQFKEINEAYQVLGDQEKRARYDRFGHAGVNGGGDRPFDGFDPFGGFGDIFDTFFGGGGRGASQPRAGEDISQRITLTFEEAVFGCDRDVEITRTEPCSTCSGGGNQPGTEISTCSTCNGVGQVRRSQRSVFGQFAVTTPCPSCNGSGRSIETPCNTCRGRGQERRRRTRTVTIPAGVDDGMQVRVTGEGGVGSNGGPAGNLYVQVRVQDHPFFWREDQDLVHRIALNVAEAALGATKAIPTLDGEPVDLEIPAGTQSGSYFRVRGFGVPHLRRNGRPTDRRGDIRVIVDVDVPTKLNKYQRELLESLAYSLGNDGKAPPTGNRSGSGTRQARTGGGKGRRKAAAEDTPKDDAPVGNAHVEGEDPNLGDAVEAADVPPRAEATTSADRGSGDGSSSADSFGADSSSDDNADANDKQRGIFDRIKDTFSPNTD